MTTRSQGAIFAYVTDATLRIVAYPMDRLLIPNGTEVGLGLLGDRRMVVLRGEPDALDVWLLDQDEFTGIGDDHGG